MPKKHTFDLGNHLPRHPFMKGVMVVLALVGLTGLRWSITHADLQIQSSIDNVIQTIKELRITTDGSPQGDNKVILSSTGIWVDPAALGGPTGGVLKTDADGYIVRDLINGSNIQPYTISGIHIATGTITTGHLTGINFSTGGGATGTVTLTCGAGETMIGISNGAAQCAPIIGTGDCGSTWYVQGWSSTGTIICNYSSGWLQNPGGSSLWHAISGTNDIFYWTWFHDSNGNVGVGTDTPMAKLHVDSALRVDMSGSVMLPTTGGGGYSFVLTGAEGFHVSSAALWMGVIHLSSAFLPYAYPARWVDNLGTSVDVYTELQPYQYTFWSNFPRCDCDTSASTNDCGSSIVSNHSAAYCVDVADGQNDSNYPVSSNPPATRQPVRFYYNVGLNTGSVQVSNAASSFIAAAARVGINTLFPAAALEVVGNVRFSSYAGYGIRNLGVDGLGNVVLVPSISNLLNSMWMSGSNGAIYYNGGSVGIGVANPQVKLHVGGDIIANTTYIVSDETLKESITPITGAISKIDSLTGYTFTWKTSGRADIGLLAQEVENVFPEIVHTDEDGYKSVEYANLIGLVIQAIKELDQRATDLNTTYGGSEWGGENPTVTDLYNQYVTNATAIDALEARVTALENE